ncbi:MAG: hypothetical protein J5855_11225 [Mailhella sp.]|nr:hypothetical protein [Mailhella sp.]
MVQKTAAGKPSYEFHALMQRALSLASSYLLGYQKDKTLSLGNNISKGMAWLQAWQDILIHTLSLSVKAAFSCLMFHVFV